MSDSEEIRAVYEDDIAMMSYIVERRRGKKPFYDNFRGMSIRKNFDVDPCETEYLGEDK